MNNKIIEYKTILCFILLFVIVAIMFFSIVSAEENISDMQKSELCIDNSKKIIAEMNESGFNTQRTDDLLKNAQDLYSAKLTKKNNDFSAVISYCKDIENIQQQAYSAKDEFYSLEQFYNSLKKTGINMSEADIMINEINQEIIDERYEKAREKISIASQRISEIRASATTLNLFYRATTRSLRTFLEDNWITIISFIALLIILFIIYRKAIRKYLIKRKLNHLETEKQVLKKLVQNTQKDYFQEGKIPEGLYNIRIKKFAELIRDIDRQIPLLREGLVKVERNTGKIKRYK